MIFSRVVRKTAIAFAVCVTIASATLVTWNATIPPVSQVDFGTTFSKSYATELGLDWREAYVAVLDQLGVRRLRVPTYWNDIEPRRGQFDFEDLDWQLAEASKRGVKVILTVGQRAPRWPECYVPDWAKTMDGDTLRASTVAMVETVVLRYRGNAAIAAWQVENEPFYPFGDCKEKIDTATVVAEADAVRALDDRPVLMQDIGEFSMWTRTARITDTLGISTYRIIWNRHFGYVRWPGIAGWYRFRGALARRHVDKVIITELQAEPWVIKPIAEVPVADQMRQMNARQFASNVDFARRIGFPEAYLWGAEWWYWMKENGQPEVWDAARDIFSPVKSTAVALP